MITIYNASSDTEKLITDIYNCTIAHFNQSNIFEVEVEIISADEMKSINNETRNINEVTDVLSFPSIKILSLPITKKQYPLDINCDTGKIMLGEIVLCAESIKAQAIEFGHSITRETGYLFLHGLLHLLGFDHIDEDDRKIMRKKEEAILSELNIKRG